MKLRNKKTGEILENIWWDKEADKLCLSGKHLYFYSSLAELNEEWEDYEESKKHYFITEYGKVFELNEIDKNLPDTDIRNINCVENIEDYQSIDNYFESEKEAQKAVEKLKAWKRLKDKNFHFLKYSALGCGEIEFSLDFEDMDDEGEIGELQHDLDLLFGGEE